MPIKATVHYGQRYDEERAEIAAQDVLDRAGVSATVAQALYRQQLETGIEYEAMSFPAQAWADAFAAADLAATEGWHDPNAVSVELEAW
jgi:hypothetical protein